MTRRRPVPLVAVAAGVVTLAVAGAVVASQVASPTRHEAAAEHGATGPGAAQHGTTGGAAGHGQVVLTARMVRRLAVASKVALARAGHLLVSYVDSDPGGSTSGTLDITFSGRNYSAVSRQRGSSGPFESRIVAGQLYARTAMSTGQAAHWYHSVNQTSRGGQSIPDPRKLLAALRPAARFTVIGTQVIDGVRVDQLKAADLRQLQGRLLFFGLQNASREYLTALDLWVDSNGVVRQMSMRYAGIGAETSDVATQLVRFVDIGRPESITAPAHYIDQVTHG